MAEIAHATLAQDLKRFGRRVFEFTVTLEPATAEILRRRVAEAPRRFARHAAMRADSRMAARELECAFKAISGAVETLDRIGGRGGPRAVEASALAQEGSLIAAEIFDLVD